MKISYILPDFDENATSGGLYVIFEHCNGLIRRGHSVRAFNSVGRKSRYLRLDCEVERHHQDPAVVESSAPDIIVGTHWRTYFFLRGIQGGLRNGARLFFLIQSDDRALVNPEERALVDKALTGTCAGAMPIYKIAVSRYIQDILRDDFGQGSFYVKNGFEPRKVTALLCKTEKVRIVARYDTSQYRGWDLVDDVLRRISKDRDDVEIHLFEMKEKKPTRYRSIFHKGLTGDRLLGLLKSCDIYIAGSRYEGFAYPALEAMSQGCVVSCTDAGGNREFCVDGETSLLSGRDDAEALYNNVKRLLDDKTLRGRLRANGIKKAYEFRWADSIEMLEKAFLSASGEKAAFPVEAIPPGGPEQDNARKAALFVYKKDPLADYADWLKVDETVKYLRSEGYSVDVMLFIDRHNGRAVRGRLDMLLGGPERGAFDFLPLYHKKIRLRIYFLNNAAFACWSVFKLLYNILLRKKKYAALIVDDDNGILKFLASVFKIDYRRIGFDGVVLGRYAFGSYAKDHALKENDYRGIVRGALRSHIGKTA